MQRIVVKQAITKDAQFTSYVMFGFDATFEGLNVGLGKADGFNQVLYKHFEVYGFNGNAAVTKYPQGNQLKTAFKASSPANAAVDDPKAAKAGLNTLGSNE
jgi:hypothetical protein